MAAKILANVRAMLPESVMEDAEVVGHWSGLRPGRRGGCRLEIGKDSDGLGRPIVHCYGHGGAGVTCSWGCADEVVVLAQKAVATPMLPSTSRSEPRAH